MGKHKFLKDVEMQKSFLFERLSLKKLAKQARCTQQHQ